MKNNFKILMTGAGGFLGFHIAKKLIEEGHQVTNFSRNHHQKLDQLNIKTICGDLSNPLDIEKAFNQNNFDSVIHVAAKVGMWGRYSDFLKVNVEGTRVLVELAKKNGVKRFVFTSSPSVVFGREDLKGVDENQPYPALYLNSYAKTKAMAEKYVLESNSDNFFTTALRPHLIYGEDDPNLIPRLIEARKKNRLKRVGEGENLVDIIYVKNAAQAHVNALERIDSNTNIHGQAYFLGQERPVKLWSFIDQLLETYGQPKVDKSISFSKAYFIGSLIEKALTVTRKFNIHPPMTRFMACQLAKNHYFDHKRAEIDLNYKPLYTINESLKNLKENRL